MEDECLPALDEHIYDLIRRTGHPMNFMSNESAQKLRGGYYTPADLAAFIAKWVLQSAPRRVLEPSCGDGAFFEAVMAASETNAPEILAFEIDSGEAAKARNRARALKANATVYPIDFLGWALSQMKAGETVDGVVGNPPFIRYQYLPEDFQDTAKQVFDELGCKFTKHTNAWVPFVLASLAMLKPGGRLGMIVPSEIIHVIHAQSLRDLLGKECRRLVIIDPQEIWFDDTLQGAVILLAEKRRSSTAVSEGLGVLSVSGRDFLNQDPSDLFAAPKAINGKTVAGKWTRAFLDQKTRDLFDKVRDLPGVHQFKDIARVDVGIVTGANKFFLVPDDVVRRNKLSAWAHPMFGRSEHCPGIIYDEAQHARNAEKGNPTNFLWFDEAAARDAGALSYIKEGEKEDLHTRYKCRTREPWFRVPYVYSTQVGMLKRCHDAPRLILNEISAFTTDTAYRISTDVDPARLVASFINPLTALSAELEGRHYGGGVLELVPSEIEKLLIPIPEQGKPDLARIDKAVRSRPMDQVLRQEGAEPLLALGLSRADVDTLAEGWLTLKRRRHRADALAID